MKRVTLILFAAVFIAVFAFLLWPRHNDQLVGGAAGRSVSGSPLMNAVAGPPNSAAAPESRSTLADTLNSPTTDIRADLRVVADVLDAFRSNFPHAGNPVGANDEITATLTGKNKLHLALIPPRHPAINAAGELCDRWGTPFFFHAESGTKMAIRSAGPDKKMWTDDDIVLSP